MSSPTRSLLVLLRYDGEVTNPCNNLTTGSIAVGGSDRSVQCKRLGFAHALRQDLHHLEEA